MKHLLSILLVPFCALSSFAQTTDAELQQRYWNYRDRFKKYFVNIGRNEGQSLPIATWVPNHDCFVADRTWNGVPEASGAKIDVGEGLGNIGDYMAFLAMEYYLLKQNGEDVTGTLNEIYYTLNALDRVDLFAEGSFAGGNPTRNGFTVRDDNKLSFINHWPEVDNLVFMKSHNAIGFNFRIGTDNVVNSQPSDVLNPAGKLYLQTGMKYWFMQTNDAAYSGSPWNGYKKYEYWQWNNGHECGEVDDLGYNPNSGMRSEMSQDHLINYITGLKFIHSFVDNVWVQPTQGDDGFKIIDKVKEVTYRFLIRVASKKDISNNPVFMIDGFGAAGKIKKSSWLIVNPVTGKVPLNGGYLTFAFAYPLAVIGKSITGVDFDYGWEIERENGTTSKSKDWVKNTWWEGFTDNFLKKDVNAQMVSWAVALSGTWDHSKFKDWAMDHNYPWFELMYAVLHNKTPLISQSEYTQWLLSPSCEGIEYPRTAIFDFTLQDIVTEEIFHETWEPTWTDKNDLKSQLEAHENDLVTNNAGLTIVDVVPVDPDRKPFNRNSIYSMPNRLILDDAYHWGQYNAMDYLLTYNLYRIAQTRYWNSPPAEPYLDRPCPCISEDYSLIKPILKDQNGNSITTLNTHFTTLPRNEEYSAFRVFTPEFLLHNLTVNNNGIFEVGASASFCNGDVTVESGGKVLLSPSTNNNYNKRLYVQNSTLTLENNAILEVNDNSVVTIQETGKLKILQGARIILKGPNSVLHIKGTLELGTGAIFQIEGGTNGKGYIIWESCWNSSIQKGKLIAGNGSKIILGNSSSTSRPLALICKGNLGLMTGWNLAELKVENCKIQLGAESRIVSECGNTEFLNVDVEGHMEASSNPNFDWKLSSMGIHVLGKKNKFNNIYIKDCALGMKIFNVGTVEPLNLTNVDFNNCRTGILNTSGRVIYNGGTINGPFNSQLISGITAVGVQGATYLNRVNISIPNYGPTALMPIKGSERTYNVQAHGTGRYYLTRGSYNYSDISFFSDQAYVFPKCADFVDNKKQLSLTQSALLNATNGGYNHFRWNYQSILNNSGSRFIDGTNGIFIYLEKGANYISGTDLNYHFLEGSLHRTHLLTGTNLLGSGSTNSLAINGTGNNWHIYGNSYNLSFDPWGPNANISLSEFKPSSAVHFDINQFPEFTPTGHPTWEDQRGPVCDGTQDKGNFVPITISDPTKLADLVQSKGSNYVDFAIQIQRTLDNSALPGRDYPALILSYDSILITPVDDSIAALMMYVYQGIQDVYMDVFTDTLIDSVDRASTEASTYAAMLELQDHLLDLSESEHSYWRFYKFELNRDLALIHRKFGHRSDGISHIYGVINTFSDASEIAALNSWNCILGMEQEYLDSIIPYDSVDICDCLPSIFTESDTIITYEDTVYYSDTLCWKYVDSVLNSFDSTFWSTKDSAWFTDSFTYFYLSFAPCYDLESGSLIAPNRAYDNDYYAEYQKSPGNIKNFPIEEKESSAENKQFLLYPNPTDNTVTISCQDVISSIEFRQMNGKLIKSLSNSAGSSITVDIEFLSSGLYLVEVCTGNGNYVRTLIVNR